MAIQSPLSLLFVCLLLSLLTCPKFAGALVGVLPFYRTLGIVREVRLSIGLDLGLAGVFPDCFLDFVRLGVGLGRGLAFLRLVVPALCCLTGLRLAVLGGGDAASLDGFDIPISETFSVYSVAFARSSVDQNLVLWCIASELARVNKLVIQSCWAAYQAMLILEIDLLGCETEVSLHPPCLSEGAS
jgi:hypothetical protein